MNLKPELVDSLRRIGFVAATDVQAQTIPKVLEGKNVIVRAQTGTGKTAAFIVPIMQMLKPSNDLEALIIAPTRELALQVSKFAQAVGKQMNIYVTTVYGGVSINMQIQALRNRPNIVVGTPGRIIDLFKRGALNLSKVRFLVLDEGDIMLDMGFIDDIDYIISNLPEKRQTMLFSATMPSGIVKIAEQYSHGEISRITIGKEEEHIGSTIKHVYAIVPYRMKFQGLLAYIKEYEPKKAIIFARTKYEANTLHRVLLSQGHEAILMHGGLTQSKREYSLSGFRRGARFLIATNVASRGLDIAGITHIINFGAPDSIDVYIHRVGRTARLGKDGVAVTIADPSQLKQIGEIEDYANVRMTRIELNLEPFRNIRLPIYEERRDFGRRGEQRVGRGPRGMFGRGRSNYHRRY